jgi:hypothetical protein
MESLTESLPWKLQRKHFFIISSSGKPIYSLHGDETELTSLSAIIQTLISFFLEDTDPIKYLKVILF